MNIIFLILALQLVSLEARGQGHKLSAKKLTLVERSIEGLLRPLLPMKTKLPAGTDFRVDQCEKQNNIDWRQVLLLKDEVTLVYKYSDGCDIQGTIKPKVFAPFPASLELRKLGDFKKVVSENKITSSIERSPLMTLDILKGTLTDNVGKIDFEADYKVKINPLSKEDFISENLGGEVRINRIYGQKVSITKKIFIE